MVVTKDIVVIKKPRSDPIPDKPIKFAPLENLHLELMENKKKLKPGLPLVQIVKKKPAPPVETKKETFIEIPEPKKETIKKPETKKEKVATKKSAKPKKEPIVEEKDEGEEEEVDEGHEEVEEEDEGIEEDDHEEVEEGHEEEKDELEDLKDTTSTPNKPEEKTTAKEPPVTEEKEEDDEYANLSPEERTAKETEEYIWRFRILRKKYKNRNIPTYNEHDDLNMMKTSYNRTIKEITLEENVDAYRTYLLGGFFAIEYVGTNFLGIDLTGFSEQQTKMMEKYESMLVELGERSYNRWGMNLPVEVRLLGFIIMQAGIFYLGKVLVANGGGTISELFKAFTGQPPEAAASSSTSSSTSTETSEQGQKKMRGPSIKASDIRKKKKTEKVDEEKTEEEVD